MCAIFGARDINRFKHLYDQNLGRGNFAYGFAFRDRYTGSFYIERGPGLAKFGQDSLYDKYDYFLGHVQAPTSSIREFCNETSHPFRHENTYVSHNGVLTNDKQLKRIFNNSSQYFYNEVDSSVIPALINYKSSKATYQDPAETIANTLSMLEGTYSFWIIHQSKDVYIGRAGSTLFMNDQNVEFSSVKLPDIQTEIKEGDLFVIGNSGFYRKCYQFKANSPFLIL